MTIRNLTARWRLYETNPTEFLNTIKLFLHVCTRHITVVFLSRVLACHRIFFPYGIFFETCLTEFVVVVSFSPFYASLIETTGKSTVQLHSRLHTGHQGGVVHVCDTIPPAGT